jgi:hypothetical protein
MLNLSCIDAPDDYLSFDSDHGEYYAEMSEGSYVCGVYFNKEQLKTLRDWIDMEIDNA